MFSASQRKPPGDIVGRRSIAATTLKKAGLIDTDAKMGESSSSRGTPASRLPLPVKPGGRERKRGAFTRTGLPEKDHIGMQHPRALRRDAKAPSLEKDDNNPFTVKAPIPKGGAAAVIAARTSSNHGNIPLLKKFIEGRYDPERKFLNMEYLKQDPFWSTNKILPPDDLKAAKDIGPVLFKLASQLKPPVETLSFANNEFRSLRQFTHLARYLPNLVNLSLQNNRVTNQRDIAYLSGRGDEPPKLREIVFLGNPFHTLAKDNDRLDTYRAELRKRLPELSVIDMQPITKIGFDVSAPTTDPLSIEVEAPNEFPVPVLPAVMPEDTQAITTSFLVKFFPAFDSARSSLINAYHPNATFSHSANTGIPPRARIRRFHTSAEMPHQKHLVWEPWITTSRNLSHSRSATQATKLLCTSAPEIVKAIERLPVTHHDVANGGDKFIVDAWLVNGVVAPETSPPSGAALFATVHGEFAEKPSNGIRSFDRTFILVPPAAGSPAALAGWPLVIMSDQLVVRAYSSPESWAPGPMAVQAPEPDQPTKKPGGRDGRSATPGTAIIPNTAVPVPPAAPAAPPSQTEEGRSNLVKGVMSATGLNEQYAIMCLEGNNWHFGNALKNFNELKPSIPPEAFIRA